MAAIPFYQPDLFTILEEYNANPNIQITDYEDGNRVGVKIKHVDTPVLIDRSEKPIEGIKYTVKIFADVNYMNALEAAVNYLRSAYP